MSRQPVAAGLLYLALLGLACAEKESPVEHDSVLSVPEEYATPQAAAAVAEGGDRIVLRYREAVYLGDLELPEGVSLLGHTLNPLLPRIRGRVTVNGSDEGVRIERLRIENPDGGGLRLVGSACRVEELWIHDCAGPGVELIGDAPAQVMSCDIQRCAPGILIRDTTLGGNYADAEHPAARLTSNNLLENGPPGDLENLVFANIPVLYTVYVSQNHWGEGVIGVTAIDATIFDTKDQPSLRGLADTEYEGFISFPNPLDRWWQDR
ncbi:hypothetical protein FJ251_05475 [bacterium]|nr:hypothetical protein [bacterium]